jgi:hypothetical protein
VLPAVVLLPSCENVITIEEEEGEEREERGRGKKVFADVATGANCSCD